MFTFKTPRMILVATCTAAVGFAACDTSPDDDGGAGEEEVITHVEITLTPTSGGADVTATAEFSEAGVLISIDTLRVAAGALYNGATGVRNELASDPDEQDVTSEIREEGPAHQFFYIAEGDLAGRVTVDNRDLDDNGDPLGLTFDVTVSAGSAATGGFRVKLRHYETATPDKSGDSATASEVAGVVENDINVAFPARIL